MTGTSGPRLAVNPIAYWLAGGVPDRTTRTLGPAFTELAEIGYTRGQGRRPRRHGGRRLPAVARVVRAGAGAEPLQRLVRRPGHPRAAGRGGPACSPPGRPSFGQRFCMISTIEPPGSPRREPPGGGPRLRRRPARRSSSTASPRCCAAMRDEGVHGRPAPARRRAGWRPSTSCARCWTASARTCSPSGPDTGHMSWAGMDVPAVLRDYADRIVGVHLKDTFAAGIARARGRRPRLRRRRRSRAGSGPSRGSARSTWRRASRRSPPTSPATT